VRLKAKNQFYSAEVTTLWRYTNPFIIIIVVIIIFVLFLATPACDDTRRQHTPR